MNDITTLIKEMTTEELKDLQHTIDKLIENRIAVARHIADEDERRWNNL